MFTIDWFVLRLLFFFALAVSFILTERRFSFDFKQKAKMFIAFFIISYIGLIIGIIVLGSIADYFRGKG